MSVLRTVLSMDATCIEWLDREGVPHPEPPPIPRLPTPREVTEVLQQLPGYTASVSASLTSGKWSAEISATDFSNPAWAVLRVCDYHSDNQPHELYFPDGWREVIFSVVERLSHYCGPLVVVDDSGGPLIVVRPNDSIEDLLRQTDIA